MSRSAYFKALREDRIARGLCSRSGCAHPRVDNRTQCEKHGQRSRDYWHKVRQFRAAGVEVPA